MMQRYTPVNHSDADAATETHRTGCRDIQLHIVVLQVCIGSL